VTLRNDGDSTRITFLPNDSNRIESQSMCPDLSQCHFYKISKNLIDKASSLAHKEMSFLCFSDDQYWRKFSVLTVFPNRPHTFTSGHCWGSGRTRK